MLVNGSSEFGVANFEVSDLLVFEDEFIFELLEFILELFRYAFLVGGVRGVLGVRLFDDEADFVLVAVDELCYFLVVFLLDLGDGLLELGAFTGVRRWGAELCLLDFEECGCLLA